ncbi:hypothetical protein F4827_005468 [Paraburkholderia bannensis]|uniref:Peptidase C39-like domain-containing protein n=1 Tax=Paraburkholderia bannensis TaxID=765414 RepID=A0A7W9WTR7_9BURK|nr:hypothetical protein [Paraburkholderia sp. WP4_3_2]MBB6105600.1 hypothetical protein [Paraburkholderia bannensis]
MNEINTQAAREQQTGQRKALAQEKEIRHFGVPYYSQWGSPEWVARIVEDDVDPCDDPAWGASGFGQPEQYRFWAKRLCGLTCFESALDYWGIEHAPRAAMLEDALRHGVYRLREDGGVDGLIYHPFAAWAESAYGVRVEVMTDEDIQASAARLDADTLAIVSVSPEIRYPERANVDQGGHLILLHGRSDGGVWFHNPSGVAPYQANAWLPYGTVARFHARRGMALTRITVDETLAE